MTTYLQGAEFHHLLHLSQLIPTYVSAEAADLLEPEITKEEKPNCRLQAGHRFYWWLAGQQMRHNCDQLQTRPSGSSHLTDATVEFLLPEYSIKEMVLVWQAILLLADQVS